MLNKKNVVLHLLSLCVLCIGFVLCRYVCFDIHGMKQFPVLLFGIGLVSVVISFLLKGKVTSVCIALAYIVGFIAGVIFGTDGVDAGGAATNNLWVIWLMVFVCLILVGAISDRIISSNKKASK